MLDPWDLLGIIWSSAGWVIPFFLIVSGIKLAAKARSQGWIGERLVANRLDRLGHSALHDIILPDGRGGLTQIDHLLLNGRGIWVLETKTFTGRLFGRPRDKQWTQRIGKKSYRIGNPLRQNYGHLKAIESIVNEEVPIHGLVVLAGSAKFPNGTPDGVVHRRRLLEVVGPKTTERLPETWARSWSELSALASSGQAARRQHRKQLEAKFGRDKHVLVGGMMVLSGLALASWMMLA
jgi:hypothetical protein